MPRIINPESAGKERTRLSKAIVAAIRQLNYQTKVDDLTRDLGAFIALAIEAIGETIDPSVQAWEKRDYWVKADRFRQEWAWTKHLGQKMRDAVLHDEWEQVALLTVQVAAKLSNVKVSPNHRLGTPWIGAFQKLQNKTIPSP